MRTLRGHVPTWLSDQTKGRNADQPVFRSARLNAGLAERDAALVDGTDCTWVHNMWLAWQRHYISQGTGKGKKRGAA